MTSRIPADDRLKAHKTPYLQEDDARFKVSSEKV
jgi:hypothetical protein